MLFYDLQTKARTMKNSVSVMLAKCVSFAVLVLLSSHALSAELQSIDFHSEPGGSLQVRMTFDAEPPTPDVYNIERPARISLDLPGVSLSLIHI